MTKSLQKGSYDASEKFVSQGRLTNDPKAKISWAVVPSASLIALKEMVL